MKILCTSDWHITNSAPKCRKDDYSATQFGKIKQLLDVAENKCDAVIVAGDMFDGPSISFSLLFSYIKLFRNCKAPIFSIYGQHDMRYRSRENTPLDFLSQCEIVKIIENKSNFFMGSGGAVDSIKIVGRSFGEELKDKGNILVIHEMIVDQKLWAGQKDYLSANSANKWANGFDFVLSGDNHQSFCKTNGESILFNPGSLMRSRSDQKKHIPVCGIYDTETKSIDVIEISVQPVENIMDVSDSSEIDPEIRFKEFFDNLSPEKDKSRIDFVEILRDNVRSWDKAEKETADFINKGTVDFIEEIISNVTRR